MQVRIARLPPGQTAPFDCGDPDLNDFFTNDWEPHERQLLAVTYDMFVDGERVAMFSLANDRLDAEELGETRKERTTALRGVPWEKRGYQHFPAVKIVRLGVGVQYQGKGIGGMLLEFLKGIFRGSQQDRLPLHNGGRLSRLQEIQ